MVRGLRSRRTWAFVATGALVVATMQVRPADATDPFPAVLLPATGAYAGTYVKPRSGETAQTAIQRVEASVGRTFAIDHRYYKWDSVFPSAYDAWTTSVGRIPYVNWNARRRDGSVTRWASIASGDQDALIVQRAQAIKAYGQPMYLTFHHEPENDGVFGTAADFVAAFRHIVSVFRAQGVGNVAWVVTLLGSSFITGAAPAWYPGDDVVDFIACDSYNWYPGRPGAKWRSFKDGVSATVVFAQAHGKPVVVAEYGVQEDPNVPGRKGQWFLDAAAALPAMPSIKAVLYFDSPRVYDWTTDTSTSSLTGYRALVTSTYLNA